MASYLRSTGSYALAPLHATRGLIAKVGAPPLDGLARGWAFLARDRREPAAALLGLAPLVLELLRDSRTERALQEALHMIRDAVRVLQREEIQTIANAVSHTRADAHALSGANAATTVHTSSLSPLLAVSPPQSLSLLSSQPVTDLVAHASSTVVALLAVLQSPTVDKMNAQLDRYFSYLLADQANRRPAQSTVHIEEVITPPTLPTPASSANAATFSDIVDAAAAVSSTAAAIASAASTSTAASTAAASPESTDSSDANLRECVQLLLLLELLSDNCESSGSPTSASRPCTCPDELRPVQKQAQFTATEARQLRQLVRKRDLQLVMLYRFHLEMTRQNPPPPPRPVEHVPLSEQSQLPCASHSPPRHTHAISLVSTCSNSTAAAHPPRDPSHSRGDSSGDSSTNAAAATSTSSSSSSPPADATSSTAATTEPAISASTSSLYSTPRAPRVSFAHVHRAAAEAKELAAQHAASTAAAAADSDGAATPSDGCLRHVPQAQARFVFCVREMLADLQA